MEFKKEYLHVLYEQQHENFHITLDQYKELLKNSVKFKNGKIIIEDKQLLIDIPNELINFLITHKDTLIKGNDIKTLLRSSKHWINIKNVNINDLYFTIFNFNSESDIDKFNFNCYNIPSENLNIARNYFNESCKDLDGFYNQFKNLNVIAINSNNQNVYYTIYHELSHFIQINGNIRIVKGISLSDLKNKDKLKSMFDISYNTVLSYFSSKEFVPHIDDLTLGLKKTNEKYYNDISKLFNDLINFLKVKNKQEMINHKLFIQYELSNDGDTAPLIMFLFSYIAHYKFQKIYNLICTYFNINEFSFRERN